MSTPTWPARIPCRLLGHDYRWLDVQHQAHCRRCGVRDDAHFERQARLDEIMRTARRVDAEMDSAAGATEGASVGQVFDDLRGLACWLERNDRDRNPLKILEAWDVPTADHQGYLEGLRDAAKEIRALVDKWEAV